MVFDLWVDITGLSISALFFFSAGAYFNITKKYFLLSMNPLKRYAIIVYMISCVCCLLFMDCRMFKYLLNLSIIAGIISTITFTGGYLNKGIWKVNIFLSESSFFIYTYHALVLAVIVKIGVRIITEASSLVLVAIYFGSAFLTVWIGLIIYYLIKRYFPKFTGLITGNR